MNYRFLAYRLVNIYRRDLALVKHKPQLVSRYITTTPANPQSRLTASTQRWAIKRYVLLIGLPVTTWLLYRFSTKNDTRRKHRIVFGSIGRAIR